jgi:hypothetical protein
MSARSIARIVPGANRSVRATYDGYLPSFAVVTEGKTLMPSGWGA